MYVSHKLQKMAVITDKDRFISPPEKRAIKSMPSVISMGIYTVQVHHSSGDIAIRRLQYNMVIRGH